VGRHYRSMKPILCLSLLFSACMWADEAADRAAIEKVISAFNEPAGARTQSPYPPYLPPMRIRPNFAACPISRGVCGKHPTDRGRR